MPPQSTVRILLDRFTRWSVAALLGTLVVACSEVTSTSRESALRASLSESAAETDGVIINDEVWVDPTVQHEPYAAIPVPETETGGLEPSFSVEAAATEAEPNIRVGVVFVDLNAITVRISGASPTDTYELRSGSVTGPLIASGLSGDAVATRVAAPPPLPGPQQIRLALPNNTVLTTTNPVVLISASGQVRVRRTTTDLTVYRGTAEVRMNAARTFLIGVNELPIEQYIKGVVPRELGPIAFPEVEAQKAQAVAARTFARRRIQFCPASRCTNGYHIVPTTADQVYGGMSAEHPVSSEAVEGTRGVVATFNNGLIEALYSSTSGGFTANSEDVFVTKLAYLRGVPDHERGKALEHVPTLDVFRRHANPTNLRNHANGDFEADWSIFHRWYVHWTKTQMDTVVGRVQSATFIDPGRIDSIVVTQRSSSGRAFEIKFFTEKRGTLTATKDAIRSALRYVTYTSTTPPQIVLNSLRSTLFYLEPEIDPKTKAVIGWEAWGGGWGHGVGLSQTGAVGMAEKGHSYWEILEHYYQNVVLEQRWE
jgi:stage II sporulation protein D